MKTSTLDLNLEINTAIGQSFNDYLVKMESSKKWFSKRKRGNLKYVFTFYYPYTFFEWKVTVPRYLFPESKALIRIGVNGVTGLASQTELWPTEEFKNVEKSEIIDFRVTDDILDSECHRALENYVFKSLRPMKPPIYKLNKKENIYLPYHVAIEEVNGKEKIVVIEALTEIIAEAKQIKEIKEWIYNKLQSKS